MDANQIAVMDPTYQANLAAYYRSIGQVPPSGIGSLFPGGGIVPDTSQPAPIPQQPAAPAPQAPAPAAPAPAAPAGGGAAGSSGQGMDFTSFLQGIQGLNQVAPVSQQVGAPDLGGLGSQLGGLLSPMIGGSPQNQAPQQGGGGGQGGGGLTYNTGGGGFPTNYLDPTPLNGAYTQQTVNQANAANTAGGQQQANSIRDAAAAQGFGPNSGAQIGALQNVFSGVQGQNASNNFQIPLDVSKVNTALQQGAASLGTQAQGATNQYLTGAGMNQQARGNTLIKAATGG